MRQSSHYNMWSRLNVAAKLTQLHTHSLLNIILVTSQSHPSHIPITSQSCPSHVQVTYLLDVIVLWNHGLNYWDTTWENMRHLQTIIIYPPPYRNRHISLGLDSQNNGTRLVTFPTLRGVFWQYSNANVGRVVPSSNWEKRAEGNFCKPVKELKGQFVSLRITAREESNMSKKLMEWW